MPFDFNSMMKQSGQGNIGAQPLGSGQNTNFNINQVSPQYNKETTLGGINNILKKFGDVQNSYSGMKDSLGLSGFGGNQMQMPQAQIPQAQTQPMPQSQNNIDSYKQYMKNRGLL